MSFFHPKRTCELATNDSDIETPDKQWNFHTQKNRVLPKRVADLNIQDYDSDDERNDRLNCAILNDSFVLSPSKELDMLETPCRKQDKDENNKNLPNLKPISDGNDSGFISRIDSVKLHENEKDLLINPNPSQLEDKIPFRPIKIRTQLFPATETKPLDSEKTHEVVVPSIFQQKETKREDPVKIPFQSSAVRHALPQNAKQPESSLETPFKQNVDQNFFVTPSARPFSISKGSAINSLTCDREQNKRPKVLFTTPAPRPLLGPSFLETPKDVKNPARLSPIKEPSREKEKPNENVVTINGNEYVIDKKIGSGGSSSVFLATCKKSKKECAIKLVNLDGDPMVIEGYLDETKTLAKLQGNINVISLYEYSHLPEKKMLYMVMEKGESDLHKILQGIKSHMPLYTLMSYWYQILQAVNYIHENGVIHSDLKPANFLMVQGRLKLIDFGIASNIALDSTSIIKFSQAGTFNYISPEALIDTSSGDSPSTHHQPRIRLSKKSDVWSLGCILYFLLYKKTPFSHVKVIHQRVTLLINPSTVIEYPQLPNFYPPMLLEMLKKALIFNPKERASVADLLKYPFDMVIPIEK